MILSLILPLRSHTTESGRCNGASTILSLNPIMGYATYRLIPLSVMLIELSKPFLRFADQLLNAKRQDNYRPWMKRIYSYYGQKQIY